MPIEVEEVCNDFKDGRPGCLKTPDPQYTMDFSDIGEGQLLWCAHCGPEAHAIQRIVESIGDPKLLRSLEREVTEAEAERASEEN